MSKVQLCRGWWKDRAGHVIWIDRPDPENASLTFIIGRSATVRLSNWLCSHGLTHRPDGRIFPEREHSRDLIEYLGEEIEIRRVR